jgi:predicted ATPase/class 3 adenylate cyclase
VTAEPLVGTTERPRSGVEAGLSTFLFTDIEGSTRLWEDHAAAMGPALAIHDRILRDAVAGGGGTIVKTTGDGMLAVFDDPIAAIDSALTAQRALRDGRWGETGPLRVRMALHAGAAESRDGDYFGPALNRVARILAIGHGGQVLTSAVCAILSRDRLPATVELIDLGSQRLRDLDRPEQVFQVVTDDLPRAFPPLRSLSTRRTNLPVQLTSFVGRDRELAELEALLARHRLVTLIGTGGTGKTRLMLEAAGRVVTRFADGAWLAELAALGDPSQVASEIARALGVSEMPGQPALETVSAFLADKDLLLLLDNAEHLVDGVADVAEHLLAGAPRLRILTTSREALAVPGEAILQLQSLSCPKVGSTFGRVDAVALDAAAATDAVKLFAERASAVDPGFTLAAANVESVVEICRRLDGIPLAIELAAARVSAMSPNDIAKRLGDRFRLLAGGRRTAVPRQQTLHALIDWSWDLLNEADRQLLRRLSIFAGGWTAEAAARIVGDGSQALDEGEVLDGLQRLVDRSLVIVDRGPTTRYRMLETIRQYAREKLIAATEVDAVAARHLAAYEALAIAAEPHLRGPAMIDWLDRMDADAENLGVALEWALEGEPWEAVRLATALLAYWTVRVASADSDARLETAIEIARERVLRNPAATADEQSLAARLMGEAARIAAMGGRAQQGLGWATDAVTLARASGDPAAMLQAAGGMAVSSVFTGGTDIQRWFDEGLTLGAETGTWWMLAMAAGFSGATLARTDLAAGEALVLQAEDAARRSGSPYIMGAVGDAHGRLLSATGRTDEAVERFRMAIARFAEVGDERMTLAVRSDLGHALRRGDRATEAMATYRETIGGWVHFGHRGAVASQLENIAYLAVEAGAFDCAARLLGAAEAMREAAASPRAVDEEPEQEAYAARARAGLESAAFAAAWAAGRALTLPQAVAFAIA